MCNRPLEVVEKKARRHPPAGHCNSLHFQNSNSLANSSRASGGAPARMAWIRRAVHPSKVFVCEHMPGTRLNNVNLTSCSGVYFLLGTFSERPSCPKELVWLAYAVGNLDGWRLFDGAIGGSKRLGNTSSTLPCGWHQITRKSQHHDGPIVVRAHSK